MASGHLLGTPFLYICGEPLDFAQRVSQKMGPLSFVENLSIIISDKQCDWRICKTETEKLVATDLNPPCKSQ